MGFIVVRVMNFVARTSAYAFAYFYFADGRAP